MGWRTVADVRDHSRAEGSAYTVLLMLAERAPDETRIARPGVTLLAKDSRVSPRTAKRKLVELEAMGEIEAVAHRNGGRGMATEWRILVAVKGDNLTAKGDTTGSKGATADTPTKEPKRNRTHTGGYDPDQGRLDAPEIPTAALPVLSPLQSVAVERDVVFEPAAMIAECRARGDRDHVREAERFAAYYRAGGEGENSPIKSLRGRWRTWLGRAPTKATAARPRRRNGSDPSAAELRAAAEQARAMGQ